MKKKTENLGDLLNTLALRIARDAGGEDVTLGERLDAIKTLSPYYLGTVRTKVRHSEEDEETTFNAFRAKITAASQEEDKA